MKHLTFNRILIAFVLVYFPIATLGATGSYWQALQSLVLLASVIYLGFTEGQKKGAQP